MKLKNIFRLEKPKIDNSVYENYGEMWYRAESDPIAILRQEAIVKNKFILSILNKQFGNSKLNILDMGCGGGLLSNELAKHGHFVTGIDISKSSIEVAEKYDKTSSVKYIHGNAYNTQLEDESFDVVLAMDLLEHVEFPENVVNEASRLIQKNGLFFYHTFNRNFLSYLIIIKFIEWFCPGKTKNIHVYHMFIKPKELFNTLRTYGFNNLETKGLAPCVISWATLKSIITQKVSKDFSFKLVRNVILGYLGYAKKD